MLLPANIIGQAAELIKRHIVASTSTRLPGGSRASAHFEDITFALLHLYVSSSGDRAKRSARLGRRRGGHCELLLQSPLPFALLDDQAALGWTGLNERCTALEFKR